MPRGFANTFCFLTPMPNALQTFVGDLRPSWVSPDLSSAENSWFWVVPYLQLLQTGIPGLGWGFLPGRMWFSTSAGDAEDGQASWKHRMDGPSHPTTKGLSPPSSLTPCRYQCRICPDREIQNHHFWLGPGFCHSSSVSPHFSTFAPTTLKPQICQNTQRCCQRLSNSF